jgi:hypothetical protein
MDFNALEDGGRQIVINKSEFQEFEICLGGKGGLYLTADKTHLKVFRHSPSRVEDPYQPISKIQLVDYTA